MSERKRNTSNQCSNSRAEFTEKMKYWFQSKGILGRLELYLRSQMILEFQRNCGQSVQPQNNAVISPKIQAVKLLIADFLLQEDLLFSLSVYCSEVPFLLNLTQYSQYISHLSEPNKNPATMHQKSKPRFSLEDLTDILEALQFNLNPEEINILYETYKTNKFSSLLACSLSIIPRLVKKYRKSVSLTKKTRKNEKLYRKLLNGEKGRTKRMYLVLQDAYGIVDKHRHEMKDLLRKQDEAKENTVELHAQLAELRKKEVELMTWHKALELKESSLEKIYRNKIQEVEEQSKLLERRDLELQNQYQILHQEKVELRIEKEGIEKWKQHIQVSETNESVKLQEFEQKFQVLQEEVKGVLKTYCHKQNVNRNYLHPSNKEPRSQDTEHCGQQIESAVFSSMEEYINLMEKENSLLKLSSTKQRGYISQLTNEVDFLKNRLNYLEKEMKICKPMQLGSQQKLHSIKYWHSENEQARKSLKTYLGTYPPSRRKLFPETKIPELKSSSTSQDATTDDIVADAKSKVKELENESETLNRNLKSLQTILTRNIAFTESKLFGSSSVSESSPSERIHHLSRLSRSYSDSDSLNISPDSRVSKLVAKDIDSQSDSPTSVDRKLNKFRSMFMKRQRDRGKVAAPPPLKDDEGSLQYSSVREGTPIQSQALNNTPQQEVEECARGEERVQIVYESRDKQVVSKDMGDIEISFPNDSKKIKGSPEPCDQVVDVGNRLELPATSAESEDRIEISGASANSKSSSDFWK